MLASPVRSRRSAYARSCSPPSRQASAHVAYLVLDEVCGGNAGARAVGQLQASTGIDLRLASHR